MSKKYILALSVFACVGLQGAPVFAQTPPTPTPTPELVEDSQVEQRTATPAMWVVKDADTTIYLFGTFHALPEGLNWNMGAVKSAFESADLLKLEIATLNADASQVQAIVEQKGRQPVGIKLSDGLNAAQKGELDRIIREAGLPPASMESLRPWLAGIYLSATLMQRMGIAPSRGVDKTLDGLARARNIPVEGFETSAEQIGFLADLNDANQRAMLVSTLEDWDQYTSQIDGLVDAWASGNTGKIDRLISGSLRKQPDLARVLLTDRNRRWADWIGARMATPGTVFVAVGTGHLAGRDNVQSFLRPKGLRAKRVDTRVRR
jgi:uncharacterized protein